jgi:carbon monoxide dehydrogenase subunit G
MAQRPGKLGKETIMTIHKYISDVKLIEHNQQIVFDYLSNFENLSEYLNSGLIEKITRQIPQVKISDFESDNDSCRFKITGMGLAEIRIVNREPHKTIKVESSGKLPLSITFWIQLMPVSAFQTKMRLTLHADMNMMIKMMAGDKLQEGINHLAERLSKLPYK